MVKVYLEADEVESLEKAATNLRDRLLIRLLFHLGCRISEALALKVEEIDFDQGAVTIQHLKTHLNLSCPKCKARLGRMHAFCPSCGGKIEKAQIAQQEHHRQRVLPVKDIIEVLRCSPLSPHALRPDIAGVTMEQIKKEFKRSLAEFKKIPMEARPKMMAHSKIVFGPKDKKGIVFVTFGGVDQGPKEALPALTYLECEMEHLRFQCVGRFACPGRWGFGMPMQSGNAEGRFEGWFKDLQHRPGERDLLKAEIFLEEILEELGGD